MDRWDSDPLYQEDPPEEPDRPWWEDEPEEDYDAWLAWAERESHLIHAPERKLSGD